MKNPSIQWRNLMLGQAWRIEKICQQNKINSYGWYFNQETDRMSVGMLKDDWNLVDKLVKKIEKEEFGECLAVKVSPKVNSLLKSMKEWAGNLFGILTKRLTKH